MIIEKVFISLPKCVLQVVLDISGGQDAFLNPLFGGGSSTLNLNPSSVQIPDCLSGICEVHDTTYVSIQMNCLKAPMAYDVD